MENLRLDGGFNNSTVSSLMSYRGVIRILLCCMLMTRCRAMHPVRNTTFGERAPHGCIRSCLRTARRNAQLRACRVAVKSEVY